MLSLSGRFYFPCVIIFSAAILLMVVSPVAAQEWEHKTNAWVPGPDSVSVRSPYDSPQPTALTWSVVPSGVAQVNDASRETVDFADLNITGFSTVDDYRQVLEGAIDEWASVADITNLGYVQETGAVGIGGIGSYIDRGPNSGVGHIRFMAFDQDGLNGATAYAQATCIPEPGASTDNGYNHARAGDVRFRSDASLWDDLLGQVYLHNIALHELGHILGFGHNAVSDSVMSAPYTELHLGAGDVAGAIFIYGPHGGGGGAVPEPAAMLTALIGFGMVSVRRRRR